MVKGTEGNMDALDSLTGVSSLDAGQVLCRNYNFLSKGKVKVSHQKSVLSDVFLLFGKHIQRKCVKSHKDKLKLSLE